MTYHVRKAFWAAMALALIMASLPRPPRLPGDPPDKVQHIIAFVVLAALAALAYPKTPVLKLAVGLSVFGAAIEVVQLIPALHRTSELNDWLADTLAATAVLMIAHLWRTASRP